jgi:CubicO group peptidase (beta-lactamase class C family)
MKAKICSTFVMLLITAVICCGQASLPSLPETPAAKEFGAWLEAFNGGDRATLQKFFENHAPEQSRNLEQQMNFRRMTGGFEFKKTEESTPVRFTAIVKEKESDQFARMTFEVDAANPEHITRIEMRAIPRPADFPLPRLSESEALAALHGEIEKRVKDDKFSGAAAISKDGKVIFSEADGMADREKKVANTTATKFRIGSMNKMFTAVAVMQLVQAGKIKLTEPLGTYLTDYPNKDMAIQVTIHQLLTHTGGTGDIFGPDFDAHRKQLRTLQDYVKFYGERKLAFPPGAHWDYSNYGFILLGAVVQKVSGEDYYEYVKKHIYEPAGMASTGSLPEDETVAGRSVGYMKGPSGDAWAANTDTLPYRGTPAGGGYSTVEDLLRFANALEGYKLLDAEHTELLTTGKVNTPMGTKYAYGFGEEKIGGARCFGHGGGAPGMNGDLKICPGAGYVIAVLANMDPPAAQRVATFAGERLAMK